MKSSSRLSYLLSIFLFSQASIGLASPTMPKSLAQQPNCENPQTQAELNYCAGQSLQRSDRELNRVYQTLLPKLSTSRRQKLASAQLNWIRFRDRECAFLGSMAAGGSIQPMLVNGCRDQLTQQRTADLKAYLRGTTVPSSGITYREVDRRLNQLYQRLQTNLSLERKSKLESAELAWITFRDTTCEFEASGGGNSARYRCMVRITEHRNRQLAKHLETNAATSKHGLFTQKPSSHSSQLGLLSSLKMILKILGWTY